MKRLIAVAAMGIALPLAVACNGDGNGGTMSVEDYFREVERIDQRSEERSAELEQELDDFAADLQQPDEEARDAIADIFDQLVGVFEEFVTDFEGLDPPEEAEDAHAEAVEALNDAVDEFHAFVDRLRAAEPEDVESVFTENISGLEDANERANRACIEIEELAAELDVEIELNCDE